MTRFRINASLATTRLVMGLTGSLFVGATALGQNDSADRQDLQRKAAIFRKMIDPQTGVDELSRLMMQSADADPDLAAQIASRILRRQPRRQGMPSGIDPVRQRALMTLQRSGNLTSRLEAFQRRLDNDPTSVSLIDELIESHNVAENHAAVAALWKRKLDLQPRDHSLRKKWSEALIKANDFHAGLEALEPLWRLQPDLILEDRSNLGRLYVGQDRLAMLARHIDQLDKDRLDERQQELLTSTLIMLGYQSKDTAGLQSVYLASLRVFHGGRRARLIERLVPLMREQDQQQATYELLIKELIPGDDDELRLIATVSRDSSDYSSYLNHCRSLVELAVRAGRVEELAARVAREADTSATWTQASELILAMLARHRGDETQLVALAEQHIRAEKRGQAIPSLRVFLQQELLACQSQPALHAGLALSGYPSVDTEAENWTSGNASDLYSIAEMLVRLKRPAHARSVLVRSADARTSDPTMPLQGDAAWLMSIAGHLQKHQFDLDALAVLAKARMFFIEVKAEQARQARGRLFGDWGEIRNAEQQIRAAIDRLLVGDIKHTVERLCRDLRNLEDDFDAYFIVIDPAPQVDARSPMSYPGRQSTADATPFLLRLLALAAKSQELHRIEEALAAARNESAADDDRAADRLAALSILVTLFGNSPAAAVGPLGDWSDRIAMRPELVETDASFLVASAALRQTETASLGRDIAMQIKEAANQKNNKNRLYAIINALVAADVSAGIEPDTANLLPDNATASDRIAMVEVHQRSGQHAAAVKLIQQVWNQDPDRLMVRLSQHIDSYIKAEQLSSLTDSLRQHRSTRAAAFVRSRLRFLWRNMPTDAKSAEHVIELYKVCVAGSPSDDTFAQNMTGYVVRLPNDLGTLDVLHELIFPGDDYVPTIHPFVETYLTVAETVRRLPEVIGRCEIAAEQTPAWRPQALALSAAATSKQGDPSRVIALADRYQNDPEFSAALQGEIPMLRRMFAECPRPAVRELSLRLWRESASTPQEISDAGTIRVADLLVKLQRPDEARSTLSNRLVKLHRSMQETKPASSLPGEIYSLNQIAGACDDHGFWQALLGFDMVLSALKDRKSDDEQTYLQSRQYPFDHNLKAYHQTLSALNEGEIAKSFECLVHVLDGSNRTVPSDFFFNGWHVSLSSNAGDSTELSDGSILDHLLRYADEHPDQRGRLTRAVDQARRRQANDHRPGALLCLLAARQGDDDVAIAQGQTLLRHVERTPEAIDDATWQVADALLQRQTTRTLGRKLARHVIDAAAAKNNDLRQAAMMAAVVGSPSSAQPADGDQPAFDETLAPREATPEVLMALADRLLQRQDVRTGLDVLDKVWKENPELVLKQLSVVAPHYLNTDQSDRLIRLLKSVEEPKLRTRYAYAVSNEATAISREAERLDEAIELCKVAIDFAPGGASQSYYRRNLSEWYAKSGQTEAAWQTMLGAILPPTGPSDALDTASGRLASLAVEFDKTQALVDATRQAQAQHPEWNACGELLIAMMRRRQLDDVRPELKLIERYRRDEEFALGLAKCGRVIMSEFGNLDERPALELALEFAEQESARLREQADPNSRFRSSTNSWSDFQHFVKHGLLLCRLGRREEGFQIISHSLDEASARMPSHYREYDLFVRRESLVRQLRTAGLSLEAFLLSEQNLSLAGTPLEKQRNLTDRIRRAREMRPPLLLDVISRDTDAAVTALRDALKEESPDVRRFLGVHDRPWNRVQTQRIANSLRCPTGDQTQLFPALLRRARQTGRLGELQDLARRAGSRDPENRSLQAVSILLDVWDADRQATIDGLQPLLESPEPLLRWHAILSLCRFPSEAAVTVVIPAASDKRGRFFAAAMLAKVDASSAIETLGRWYRESEGTLRARIGNQLADHGDERAKDWLRYEIVSSDDFSGQGESDWQIENSIPDRVTIDHAAGRLRIRADNGSIAKKNYSNLFLLPNPAGDGDFQVTLALTDFRPLEAFQQGAVVLWNDADNFLKLAVEGHGDGQSRITLISEQAGRITNRWYFPMEDPVPETWLRLRRFGTPCSFGHSHDGRNFQWHHTIVWQADAPRSLGFVAMAPGNPPPREIDVTFDRITIEKATGHAVPQP